MKKFREKHIETQGEWEADLSEKVLEHVRNELYLDLRFLDIALSALVYKSDDNIHTFATD